MKRLKLLILSGIICMGLSACNIIQTEASFNSEEQTTTANSPNVPIRLKSNSRTVKHRLPQRRFVHHVHKTKKTVA